MSATPRPWSILQEGRTWRILDANGDWVLVLHDLLELPDALRVMVRCVNAHDKLVEALKKIAKSRASIDGDHLRAPGMSNDPSGLAEGLIELAEDAIKEAGAE